MESNSSVELSVLKATKKTLLKNINELPGSAVGLYIKLYWDKKCSKKPKLRPKMREAIRSWITLSDEEKQHFYNKYKECQKRHNQTVGDCLRKAQPYMKKKINKEEQKNHLPEENVDNEYQTSISEANVDNESQMEINTDSEVLIGTNEEHLTHSNTSACQTEIYDNHVHNNEIDFVLDQTKLECDIYEHHATQEPPMIFYRKPTPPNIKTAKELFEIMKIIDNDNSATWDSLPQNEKDVYIKTVLTLKKDYIQKYKQYLEQLPLRELFDYYNKTF